MHAITKRHRASPVTLRVGDYSKQRADVQSGVFAQDVTLQFQSERSCDRMESLSMDYGYGTAFDEVAKPYYFNKKHVDELANCLIDRSLAATFPYLRKLQLDGYLHWSVLHCTTMYAACFRSCVTTVSHP